ncbi:hypothetical protein CsSME_00008348 [Camellia sinensis var. sinensis]
MEFMSVDPEGTARGLLCIWDLAVFTLSGCCCTPDLPFGIIS